MAAMDWAPVIDWVGAALGRVELLEEVDSTNAEFLRRPPADPEGRPLVLVARHQTRGRGRRGRPWHGGRDQSFLGTLGLPQIPEFLPLPCLPLLGTVGVADAIEKLGLGPARCKWPNDVLLDHGKVAGVLVEARSSGADSRAALGIGLNVSQAATEFGGDYPTPPTSLRAAGFTDGPVVAGTALLEALDQRLVQARENGPGPLINTWLGRLLGPTRRVQLVLAERTLDARLVGFEPTGELCLETEPGSPVWRVPGAHVQALTPCEDGPPRPA